MHRAISTSACLILFLLFSYVGISFGSAAENLTDGGNSPFGFHTAGVFKPGYVDNGFADAQNIGVKWAREGVYAYWFLIQPDIAVEEYDFSMHDEQWRRVPAGMNILANIAPQGHIDEGYALPGSYMPIDADKYIAFVKAAVERYDGDGIDDMTELQNPIKYWQVGNEPSVYQASGFADLQRITYSAIKDSCPDCTVLIGGATGMPPADQYLALFDSHYKPILDALGGEYVDVMDFHWYGDASGDYKGAGAVHAHVRSVLDTDGFGNIPIWITEMGSYSGDPLKPAAIPNGIDFPPQTERQQASDYFKRLVYPLSLGVKKIFPAFGLIEGFKYDGGYFDFTGLIYDGWGPGDPGLGVRKLSYYTYKKTAETLEGSDMDNVQKIRESGYVSVYKFLKNGKPIYAAWWDYFDDPAYGYRNSKKVVLRGLQGDSALATEVVPRFSSGAEVDNYGNAFRTRIMPITDGKVTIRLGDSPVFVEVSAGE